MAQRGKDTGPWSHSQQAVELGFKPGSVSLQCASKGCVCNDYPESVSVVITTCSEHWGVKRTMLTGGHDIAFSPRGTAGTREQHRLHFTVDQMLTLSKRYFPIFRGICISYFKFFGTTVDCSIFKTGWGMGKRATIMTSGLRYFPFYLQSSQLFISQLDLPRQEVTAALIFQER